ncbi:hypothetical protein GCM10010915_12800 [Microbacterium faecale]|uniref:Uncharacterized protein n=1 Tax=Microbacterium faecale TaxID=1804630 RepID=A0A916Y7A5_9MICO|nr:hypothetical protein GCM10010915_12800 [Microbacterium faecale]
MRPGPSAIAASTSSRLVSDLDPGTVTLASSGFEATGASNGPRGALAADVDVGEYPRVLIAFYLSEPQGEVTDERGRTDRTTPRGR